MFKLFAELIAFHLAADERLAASEASLSGERQNSELREQFIAVLGHDLRNPLASIDAGARLLQKTPLNEKATSIVTMMQDSVRRMAKIIDNVMDLARGRLGGGIALNRAREPLAPVLDQVIAEARLTRPERAIEARSISPRRSTATAAGSRGCSRTCSAMRCSTARPTRR